MISTILLSKSLENKLEKINMQIIMLNYSVEDVLHSSYTYSTDLLICAFLRGGWF